MHWKKYYAVVKADAGLLPASSIQATPARPLQPAFDATATAAKVPSCQTASG
jgi:hypothetical protein